MATPDAGPEPYADQAAHARPEAAPTPTGPPVMTSLSAGYRALVLGSSGGLGGAWLQALQGDPRCGHVIGLSRNTEPALILEDEGSLRRAAQKLVGAGPMHLVLDATGALHIDGRGPEKRLDELDAPALLRSMHVNAIGPALVMKHLVPLLASGERVLWAKLSARVGSIEDNRKGGWYGYRASKAALNMLLQTAAIEIARRRPMAVVVALQPGTVRSALSRPFVGDDAMDPATSARQMLQAIDLLAPKGRAHFIDYQGEGIPW